MGDTAILVSKLFILKKIIKNFIILDAAMNDFMRPALYGAKHKIIPLKRQIKWLKKAMILSVQFVKLR